MRRLARRELLKHAEIGPALRVEHDGLTMQIAVETDKLLAAATIEGKRSVQSIWL
ncbi:hypothetical protein FHX14_002559 [Rhizobium sp. BK619]|nr:hypothetical protein [Rhizobium sp. BK619]